MKKEYNFLTLLIPGPKAPRRCIDVYMKPLINELTMLWSTGVRTFDAHAQIPFTMRAALMWTISDFPSYGMLSAHSTKGYWSCPQCINDIHSEYRPGRNVICCHRMWLTIDHE